MTADFNGLENDVAMIKCPECGKEVSSLAPSCPGCGAPIAGGNITPPPADHAKPGKVTQFVVGVVVLIAAVIIFFPKNDVLPEEDRSTTPPTAADSASSPATKEPQKPVAQVTARALFLAYEKNEVATDDQLRGADVEVTGKIQSIDKDFTDSAVINFASPNEYMPVRMTMKDSEKPQAAKLSKGQILTIRCTEMKRLMGSPVGDDCVFVSKK